MGSSKTLCAIASAVAIALTSTGCTSTHRSSMQEINSAFMRDGIISIFRQAPPVRNSIDAGTMLGFVPLPALRHGAWAAIDRRAGTIELRDGEQVLGKISVEGLDRLSPGVHHIVHKQKSPLWYASDEYYAKRSLPIPPQGDRSRLLKGALGSMAIYLDKNTPIHTGPVWTSEVGGVRLEESDLSRLYYSLPVGATIDIR